MRALPGLDIFTENYRQPIPIRGFGGGRQFPRTHGELNEVEFGYWELTHWRPFRKNPMIPPAKRTTEHMGLVTEGWRSALCQTAEPYEAFTGMSMPAQQLAVPISELPAALAYRNNCMR
jgi:hypothetical protein